MHFRSLFRTARRKTTTGYNNLWSLRPIFFVQVKAVQAVDTKNQGTIVEAVCIS